MGTNVQKLGEVLSSRMTKTAGAAVPISIELGTINSNLSLRTDSLRAPIPKGDYMIDITLICQTYNTSIAAIPAGSASGISEDELDDLLTVPGETNLRMRNSGIATISDDDGDDDIVVEHDHRLPENFRGLKPGDRVLVAWCGFEPVVIAIVSSS